MKRVPVEQDLFVYLVYHKSKMHPSSEIEDFGETHLCKLFVTLRSRVLRVLCPHEGYWSATPYCVLRIS